MATKFHFLPHQKTASFQNNQLALKNKSFLRDANLEILRGEMWYYYRDHIYSSCNKSALSFY